MKYLSDFLLEEEKKKKSSLKRKLGIGASLGGGVAAGALLYAATRGKGGRKRVSSLSPERQKALQQKKEEVRKQGEETVKNIKDRIERSKPTAADKKEYIKKYNEDLEKLKKDFRDPNKTIVI